jgi:hypothetical protein
MCECVHTCPRWSCLCVCWWEHFSLHFQASFKSWWREEGSGSPLGNDLYLGHSHIITHFLLNMGTDIRYFLLYQATYVKTLLPLLLPPTLVKKQGSFNPKEDGRTQVHRKVLQWYKRKDRYHLSMGLCMHTHTHTHIRRNQHNISCYM